MDKYNQEYVAFIHDQIIKSFSDLVGQECAILDFGCGDGLLTHFIQNTFYKAQISGVDSNKYLIEHAQEEFPLITFEHILTASLPFTDGTFDLIYAVDVFHHIPPKEHAKYVAELMRVLKSHGRIILFEVNPYNPFVYFQFKKNPLEKNSTLLRPSYASQLFQTHNCNVKLTYCFLSHYLPGWVKEYMLHFPFASVYSVLVYKN